MRLAMKIALWSFLALLLVCIAGGIFLATAGDDFYRWALRRAIEDRIDREVGVEGSFSFTFGLEPTVVVTDVWIENAPWAEAEKMARAQRIEVQIALEPLLSGIFLLPRLVVEGLDVDLETSAEGMDNWDIEPGAATDKAGTDRGDVSYPLIEFLSLKDISVAHRDRRSGRDTALRLAYLYDRPLAEGEGFESTGEGSLNGRPFRLNGRFAPVAQALAAEEPYPMEMTLEAAGLVADLAGTVENLPAGTGLDLELKVRSPAIGEVLRGFQVETTLAGVGELSAYLRGDLRALAAEDVTLDLIERSGQELHAEGRIADLTNGAGLDLRFSAQADPKALGLREDLPPELAEVLDEFARFGLSGRMTGKFIAPVLSELGADLAHASGAALTLGGEASLDFSGTGAVLAGFEASTQVTLPDRELLERILEVKLPDLGAIEATAELAWSGEEITLRAARAKALEDLLIEAEGRIGRLSRSDFLLRPDPRIDLSAAVPQSRRLAFLIEALLREGETASDLEGISSEASGWAAALPELGPVAAALRLSRENDAYRLDDLQFTLGSENGLWSEVAGTLGTLRPGPDPDLENMALAVTFAAPSSRAFSPWLPDELPELSQVRGRFDLQGSTETASIAAAQIVAEGPHGLVATAAGQVAELSFKPEFSMEALAFDLDVRWPNTDGLAELLDLDFDPPDLGPVRARATLNDRGETFTFTEIEATAGAADQPNLSLTGEIGDLLAFDLIALTGRFDVATALMLDFENAAEGAGLGRLRGRFDLSDADGSLGLEALRGEVRETKLLSLSVAGVFDDLARRDELRLRASLNVPDVSQLGQEFGMEVGAASSLAFSGEVSVNEERLAARGAARLGETDLEGRLSGDLKGERPAFRGEIRSPKLRVADFVSAPRPTAPEPETPQNSQENGDRWIFGETPIPFAALQDFDLDLDLLIKDIKGVRLEIDQAAAKLKLVDGVLEVDPLHFAFVGGRIDSTVLAEADKTVPEVHLELSADDVDLGDLLLQTEASVPLDGELDLTVDLRATGHSPRALASSLEGELDLALARGRIRSGLFNLTAINPLRWMFSQSARRGYTDLNCFVVRFDVKKGVADSEVFLLDTPRIRATGEGRIDLEKEFLDFAIRPRGKSRRLIEMSTPFAIRGPLTDPSVVVSTTGATARTAGEVLASPLNLLGSLLPFVSDRGSDSENPCLKLENGVSPQ